MGKRLIIALNLLLPFVIANTESLNAQIGKNRKQILSEYKIEGIEEKPEGDAQIINVTISESGELHIYRMIMLNETIEEISVTKISDSSGRIMPLDFSKAVEIMRRNSKKWMMYSRQDLQHDLVMFVSPDESEPELYACFSDHQCLTISTKKYAETHMGSAAVER